VNTFAILTIAITCSLASPYLTSYLQNTASREDLVNIINMFLSFICGAVYNVLPFKARLI